MATGSWIPSGHLCGSSRTLRQSESIPHERQQSVPGYAGQYLRYSGEIGAPHRHRLSWWNRVLTGLNPLQQLVRFVIEQYRDELMLSIGATTAEELEVSSQEDREAVASDLLNVLHRYDPSSLPRTPPYQFPRAAYPFRPLPRMVPPSCTRSASLPRPF